MMLPLPSHPTLLSYPSAPLNTLSELAADTDLAYLVSSGRLSFYPQLSTTKALRHNSSRTISCLPQAPSVRGHNQLLEKATAWTSGDKTVGHRWKDPASCSAEGHVTQVRT